MPEDGNLHTTSSQQLNQLYADLGLETEAVEMLFDGQLLLGRHLDKTLQLHALDIQTCAMVASWNIPILFNDIEGFAWPHAACTR